MQSREVVAFVATVLTVCQYCTGIPICLKIVRNASTLETSFFPLMVMFISSILWSKYGLLKADKALIFVNSFGSFLAIVYVFVYYVFTHSRKTVHRQLALGAVLVFPPLVYVKFYAGNHDDALFYMGYMCVTGSIISYGSPLSAIVEVLSTRSTATMAFPLSLANFLVAGSWLLYGFLLKDFFIQVPNALGILLSFSQLVLFWKFPSSSKTTTDHRAPYPHPTAVLTETL